MEQQRVTGYDLALLEIARGRAEASALWVLLSNESDRDGYALKPIPWEGPGEYQHVTFKDGRSGFVRIPFSTSKSFPVRRASA